MARKSWLSTTVGIGLTASFPPSSSPATPTAAMTTPSAPLRIALLGSGIFAREQHLPAILSTPSLQLIALYSRTLASASSLASTLPFSVSIYTSETTSADLSALLSRGDIDAVILGLPIPLQPSIIRACLLANKPVLSEKPVAASLSSARELITFARTQQPLWGVAENFRFQASWAYARSRIAELGRVLGFTVRIASMIDPDSNRYYGTEWRKAPKYQGGFILDGGVHFVASLRMLLSGAGEEVEKVSAFSACNMEYLKPVDTISAVVRTKKGTTGTLQISFGSTEKLFEFTVACEGGVVVVGGGGRVSVKDREGNEEVKEFLDDRGIKEEFAAFAEGVRKGELHPDQTPEEALKDLELIEKLLLSGEKDGETMTITGGLE
ncbi:hypothetical protein FN846DRAFT_959389 [Sphaerosporella brunnea]|uniref:Uncharacterized protein n=1 Tax=Sphaerosporella brunnea TaxID=1250544 RepID=A0A5J5ER08_9PEZI|nr:hypothetical protein FN846DRAFT_959389 [Sphaerosporella brunnea]